MSESENILLEETFGQVRILKLNRPEKKNGVNLPLTAAIIAAMEKAHADQSIRVIGLTGVGSAFCSGGDLTGSKIKDFNPDPLDDLGLIGKMALAIRIHCDKPVVAGVNGLAVGGGVSLAMLADIRIASSSATFNPGYARIAISPDAGLTWTLPKAIGHEQSMRFLLEQKTLSAEQALAIGMVGEVVDAEKFEHRFLEYCELLAQVSPYSARQSKYLINMTEQGFDFESVLREEVRFAARALKSDDSRNAIQALMSKGTKK